MSSGFLEVGIKHEQLEFLITHDESSKNEENRHTAGMLIVPWLVLQYLLWTHAVHSGGYLWRVFSQKVGLLAKLHRFNVLPELIVVNGQDCTIGLPADRHHLRLAVPQSAPTKLQPKVPIQTGSKHKITKANLKLHSQKGG